MRFFGYTHRSVSTRKRSPDFLSVVNISIREFVENHSWFIVSGPDAKQIQRNWWNPRNTHKVHTGFKVTYGGREYEKGRHGVLSIV